MLLIILTVFCIILIFIIAILLYKNESYKNRITGEVRAAILNPDELEKRGRDIAEVHRVSRSTRPSNGLLSRMDVNYKYIIKTYRKLNEDAANGESVIPAAEWLFDNFYIIEEQVKEIRVNFPSGFYAVLPSLSDGLLKGFPRVYDISLEIISHTDGRIEEDIILKFIKSYQSMAQLTSGELWAIPIMLRIALIENIRSICEYILKAQEQRKKADLLSDIILKNSEVENAGLLETIRIFIKDMDKLSPSFAEHLLYRIRRHGMELGPVMHFIDEKLAAQDDTAEGIIKSEHQNQARLQVSLGNSITGLRLISSLDWNEVYEDLSPVEQLLKNDPAGIYSDMDFPSRDYYRHEIEKMSRVLGISESSIAKKAIKCAYECQSSEDIRIKHVGYFIVGSGRTKLESEIGYKPNLGETILRIVRLHPTGFYLGPIILITTVIALLTGNYAFNKTGSIFITALSVAVIILPSSEIAVGIVNWIMTHVMKPTFLPKLELSEGINLEASTMVVIPALITNEKRMKTLIEELEVYYLANQQNNLFFALLGDFSDAVSENMPEDDSIIKCALEGVKRLNKKYSSDKVDIFYFFHRRRIYNPSQNKWMGWERKRGKLMEFNHILRGASDTGYYIKSGDISKIPKIKYVITLDADTELPRGTAKKLIGTISHPLNRAIMDEKKGIVIEGYGILQPRITIDVVNANKSRFSRIFAGQGGIDPYTTAVSDIYMDLFREGIYTGKGIYDVDIFLKTLDRCIPENAILSHDLLEGSYARTGLVTDIELVDGFPSGYGAYAARLHRWMRGDWQLLPWMSSKVKNCTGEFIANPLSTISKWKILDNLRRSMIPPSIILLIILSFWVLPGNRVLWLLGACLLVAFPAIINMADIVFSKNINGGNVLLGIKNLLYQSLLLFLFLPHRTLLMIDAISITLYRLLFSRKELLEWETAADAEARLKNDIKSYILRMWICPVLGIILFILVLAFSPYYIWVEAMAFSLMWMIAPIVAFLISRTDVYKDKKLSDVDICDLRRLARKTWGYFEEFAGPSENFMPPDNYQEEPHKGIAHRTSPTNMGLNIASTLAARDMGYICTTSMIEKLENIFGTMEKLDTWKGHFYNWYDTKTLQPMRPLYISTVDSGNLIGYLITLNEGISDYINNPILDLRLVFGLIDTIVIINEEISQENCLKTLLQRLKECSAKFSINPILWKEIIDIAKMEIDDCQKKGYFTNCYYFKTLKNMINTFDCELNDTMAWVELIANMPDNSKNSNNPIDETELKLKDLFEELNQGSSSSPVKLREIYNEGMLKVNDIILAVPPDSIDIKKWLKEFKSSLMKSYLSVNRIISMAKQLIEKSENIIKSTDFKPLLDQRRQIFSIGYSAEDEQLNKSYYDLLASEARQTSLVAIAKGDINAKHWFRLGRALTEFNGYKGLVSWSGTMFEYLMPLLIMKNYQNTLLGKTYDFVIKSQIAYGKKRNVPWGVSESGYSAFDINFNYQYRAFGVPRLGLKRGLVNDVVVAPYASILALMVCPTDAMENIRLLKEKGVEGIYGFYEAIDYTPERMPAGKKSVIVKSFMVHHHGMSLLSLDNVFNDNIMQNRFHKNPMIRATELLLQEKVPERVMFTSNIEDEIVSIEKSNHNVEEYQKEVKKPISSFPEAHVISNGTYYSVLNDSGSGFSRFKDIAVNRWREDTTSDGFGMFIFIRNINSNNVWTAAYEPYRVMPEEYKVIFSSDKVEYFRVDGNIDTHTEVIISPEDDVEIRRISLTNHSDHTRIIEVTSYFEVVISSQMSDIAHTAFNNLFVKTKFLSNNNTLLASRRLRSVDESSVWLFHTVSLEGESVGAVQYETDRLKFIGRDRDLTKPADMDIDKPLSNTDGAVLDPIMSLRKRVRIHPGETVKVSYATGISDTEDNAKKISSKYNDTVSIKRAFELAWTRSQVETKYLNFKSRDIELYQGMLSHIFYLSPQRRMREDIIIKNSKGQSGLWPYGISGDLPLVLVSIKSSDEIDLVYEMLRAHEYWRLKGLRIDLVILNEDRGNYLQELQEKLRNAIYTGHAGDIQDRPGGVFLRQAGSMDDEGRNIIYSTARILLRGDSGSIWKQLKCNTNELQFPKSKKYTYNSKYYEVPFKITEKLLLYNGLGGFKEDGSEYVIQLNAGQCTPAPWTNVICNENFGCIITGSGSGYTWCENSRENKLTPWSNDPVSDPPSEIIYFKDEEDGSIWTATPLPIRESEAYIIRHGFGYTVFEHSSRGIRQQMTVFVPEKDNIKIFEVRLKNISKKTRKISAIYYIRPVLGVSDQITAPFIRTEIDDSGVFLITNTSSDDFEHRTTFIDCSIKERSFTGDRSEFIGRGGTLKFPDGLTRESLSGRTGCGYDPCAVIEVKIDILPDEEKVLVFTIGQCLDNKSAIALAIKYRNLYEVEKSLRLAKELWNRRLGTIQVSTPDVSLNIMINGWLLYQTVCCRLWARSAFYQSGGAYGFRDQLQDVIGAMYVFPELAKKQIILHSEHQFLEGDVQHWWHAIDSKGIRTRFSDDLLWLAYVTADYINITEDESILDIKTHYLEDKTLNEGEDERYNKPTISESEGTIYEHCIRAIEKSLSVGEHGIPLMGCGDWNDGMNRVGNHGKGESIWLGWFLYSILIKFIPICKNKGDEEKAQKYMVAAQNIIEAIEKYGWDGSWYRRAFFDDGTPLGSASNAECQIDSISQSWSVISSGGRPKRVLEAMSALEQYLINKDAGIIMLLTPPFDNSSIDPGYIKGYVPGVRENGGQYTHAAAWVILAFAMLGKGDKAWELFNMINPINHTATSIEYSRYRVEPYVMSADVYAIEPHTGRGGWTWYTGAAGWMYRVGIENILGLKIRGDKLLIDPCIPSGWKEYTIKYKYIDTLYIIKIKNPEGINKYVKCITIDGKSINETFIHLSDDKVNHNVDIIMGY